jgi:hypothetical protein
VAQRFGLDPDPANYRECSTREAHYIGARVIAQHLLDDGPLVAFEKSTALAARFLSLFPPLGTAYFTNGEFSFFGKGQESYLSKWRQVTPERSSSGLLVLAGAFSGALWVADPSIQIHREP